MKFIKWCSRIIVPVFFLLPVVDPSFVSAQITTNTALPVTEGHGVIRTQFKVMQSRDDPTNSNRELLVHAVPVVGVYGVTKRLAAFGVFPILDKGMALTVMDQRIKRSTTGLGEIRFFLRYDLFKIDEPGKTFRIASFAGLETPTGRNRISDSFGRIPAPLQPGSGSWDPFLGAVLTRQTLDWQLDVSSQYEFNTEADNFEFGDEYRFDAAFKYRIFPRPLKGGVPGFLYLNLESNVIRQGKNEQAGTANEHSGGTQWFLAPGVQFITLRFIIEGAVQLPLVQNLNGNALKNDFISTLSVRINI